MRKISVYRMIFLMALYSIFANIAHPIEPTIYQNLGFHDYMFGVAMAAMSLTNFLFAPFWGKMMDRFGCAVITGLSFFGYAAAQYMFAVVTTEWALTLARLLAGVFISTISVSQLLYIMRYSPPERAARELMYNATVCAVFAPVGYLVGGLLGDVSIRLAMMVQVAGLALTGVLFFLILADKVTERERIPAKELFRDINPLKSFADIRPYLNATLTVFFVIAFATSFAGICYEYSFNYLIKDEYGFTPSYNGILKALVGIVALLSNATVCSFLLRRTDVRRSTVGVLAVLTVMSVGIVLIRDLVPFIIINVMFFGFNAVYLPLLQATLTDVSEKGESGIFVGMFNAVRSVGSVGGSLAAGFTYAVFPRLPFVVTAALFAFTVICAVINYRQFTTVKVNA